MKGSAKNWFDICIMKGRETESPSSTIPYREAVLLSYLWEIGLLSKEIETERPGEARGNQAHLKVGLKSQAENGQ